jgi:glycosyltransferase involved in cell wall biosynthesis
MNPADRETSVKFQKNNMHVFFYAPFKPLGHALPSGDLVIATSLFDHLTKRGHRIQVASNLRARWIYWKPWLWPVVAAERKRLVRAAARTRPDLWLTYHTYYKAPDVLGPTVCRQAGLPYVIFQGSYSSQRKRALKTRLGYHLNKKALLAARHVWANRQEDLINLGRLLPEEHLSYVAPGIHPEDFLFSGEAREELRREWGVGDRILVLSAAMFRPGVKTRGLAMVIEACGRLVREGADLVLAIAGDGKERAALETLAGKRLPGRVRFVGQVPRPLMHRFYSSGDLFVFPGFDESLGMVYLEAQSCGLPVVALADGGIPEVVDHGRTGLLVPMDEISEFGLAMNRLIMDRGLRETMGRAAAFRIRDKHDLARNYDGIERILESCLEPPGLNQGLVL